MLDIVSRRRAGLQEPYFMPRPLKLPVKYVLIQETKRDICKNTDKCFQEIIQIRKYHLKYYDNEDINYNFLIGGDGRIYEGRGWWVWPGLIRRYKTLVDQKQCLFIGYIGKFKGAVPPIMQKATEDLLVWGISKGFIKNKFIQITLELNSPDNLQKSLINSPPTPYYLTI